MQRAALRVGLEIAARVNAEVTSPLHLGLGNAAGSGTKARAPRKAFRQELPYDGLFIESAHHADTQLAASLPAVVAQHIAAESALEA